MKNNQSFMEILAYLLSIKPQSGALSTKAIQISKKYQPNVNLVDIKGELNQLRTDEY